ncbi:MAG: MarR family winged helix-turn-helix transcriptional regulator, partial [Pseudomonadota bacterium]
MHSDMADAIDHIRHESRRLVREWGFMDRSIAGTDLSPSAVHAIIEVGSGRAKTAKEIAAALMLEKSTVSRMLQGLLRRGLVTETEAVDDGRIKQLDLTDLGCRQLDDITRFARNQVAKATAQLSPEAVLKIHEGLQTYANALCTSRLSVAGENPQQGGEIVAGYQPALLGR